MFDRRHWRNPMFWLVMWCILVGAAVAFTCLVTARVLCGSGYWWWEHGSERCTTEWTHPLIGMKANGEAV